MLKTRDFGLKPFLRLAEELKQTRKDNNNVGEKKQKKNKKLLEHETKNQKNERETNKLEK